MGLLAFRTTDATRNTVVGYATYGQRINMSEVNGTVNSSVAAAEQVAMPKDKPAAKSSTLSAADQAFLDAILATEMETAKPYIQSFGKEAEPRKAIEGFKNVLKNAGKSHLIEEFERRSKLLKP